MALYCAVTSRSERIGEHWYLYTLCFSNSTHGDQWEEWQVGQDQYNYMQEDGSIIKIKKALIYNIATYNDETVVLPEDCTGMFSNMNSLSVNTSSYYSNTAGLNYKDTKKDFSHFDTSQVKCMKSMFENSFGLVHTYHYISGQTRAANYLFFNKSFKLTGLENWDVSNVTDMTRMFAHINLCTWDDPNESIFNDITWDVSPTIGIKKFTAKEMFMGSRFPFYNFNFIFDRDTQADLEGMFNGFGCGRWKQRSVATNSWTGSNWESLPIDLSGWKFSKGYSDASVNFKNMFRNALCSKIIFPKKSPDCIKNADYMFAYDSTTKSFPYYEWTPYPYDETYSNVMATWGITYHTTKSYYTSDTTLSAIQTKQGTDWLRQTFNAPDGYRMFIGQKLLNNYDPTSVNMERANTQPGYGYFESLPPEITLGNYIRLNSGWRQSSVVYFKTSEGWQESEVYM